ncbi:MAG: BON domain-containing protein [Planctomycetaceae bacterium]|jgi:osmotically-inducible protein OsmY|nr:BON domain-containing protein [Planctomycetaceae bacterium]
MEPGSRNLRGSLHDTAVVVQAHLDASPSLAGTHIRCEALEGRIVLRGYVSTYSMKHVARVLAESVSGNSRIEDHLDVIPVPPKWQTRKQP